MLFIITYYCIVFTTIIIIIIVVVAVKFIINITIKIEVTGVVPVVTRLKIILKNMSAMKGIIIFILLISAFTNSRKKCISEDETTTDKQDK